MRGRVWLQLLLALASAVILGSDSHGVYDHILLSQIRDSPQPGGPGPRICISQEQGGPVILPATGFPFLCLLRLAGLQWRYSNPPLRWGYATGLSRVYCNVSDSVRTSKGKHCLSVIMPNRSMLLGEIVAVYCENHTEHTDTLCGQNAELY
jgi:hypothetical protein